MKNLHNQTNITDEIASAFLGKKVSGSDTYNPNFLVAVPRDENRRQYGIKNTDLPFEGWDVWHCYEFSVLTENGVPVTRVLKLKYNCSNDYLIESKSLKLYLNSFNMTRLGKTVDECLKISKETIEKDLSEKLVTKVEAGFLESDVERIEIFKNFKNLITFVDETKLEINNYKEAPEVLRVDDTHEIKEYYLTFDSLRSNCRVTHQPDFGDAFICYKSKKHIDEGSLVEYLTSFRSEYHFHEECCEMIFKRISDILDKEDELFVCALYTRRGGIDICPARWSKNCHILDVQYLLDLTKLARHGIKQ